MPSNNNQWDIPELTPIITDLNKDSNTVKIRVDKGFYRAVNKKLTPYKSVPDLFRPALTKVGDYVRMEMIPRTFEAEGPGWQPLSHRSIADRKRLGYQERPILKRTGDLYNSLVERSHPRHIEVIKVGRHARIEIGSSSTKFIENQKGKKEQNLPSRPMIPGTGGIPLIDKDRIAIKNIIRKAISQRTK